MSMSTTTPEVSNEAASVSSPALDSGAVESLRKDNGSEGILENAQPAATATAATAAGEASANAGTAGAEGTEQKSNPQNNPFWKPRAPPMMGPDGKPLSRNATKKLLKQQAFLERKPLIKQQEKLKRKQKAKERFEAIEAGLIPPPPKRHKSDQIQTGITIGIDMAFDDMMLEKEVKSMVDQIKRCYSYNRTCEKIVHLSLTSFTGKSRDEFTKRANGYELWKNFTIHEKPLEQVWPSEEVSGKEHLEQLKKIQIITSAKSEAIKANVLATKAAESQEQIEASSTSPVSVSVSTSASTPSNEQQEQSKQEGSSSSSDGTLSAAAIKALEQERLEKEEKLATIPAVNKVIYLSADSPNTITRLDPGTCYVLGGIVDKNRYPNLCQEKAEELGIETGQLPISEFIQMSSRRVLTVNQVFEILLQFVECNDWKAAFLKVIPQRKLEEKPRVRRSADAWRGDPALRAAGTAGGSGSNSVASSVAGDESDGDPNQDSDGEDPAATPMETEEDKDS
ncbi:guanine-1-methyltransferase-domain-containing protein [Mortierella sp. GBAus27b]|nr:tRNA (guanine(9)-N(1))-methyltransferase [Mortierella sp. GBA43]KAI8362459.1 guanine-1-methyltransferase-domain-containing protein [Mortierella sp. GBAus27b]